MDIKINNLRVYFEIKESKRFLGLSSKKEDMAERAIDEVNCVIKAGHLTAIIGRSGSGKSVLAKAIARIIQGKPGIVTGNIAYGNIPLIDQQPNMGSFSVKERIWSESISNAHRSLLCDSLLEPTQDYPKFVLRPPKIGMVYQDPSEYIHSMFSYYDQLKQAVAVGENGKEPYEPIMENYLVKVQLPDDVIDDIMRQKNIELSGGQKQRFSFALSLAIHPAFIVADEPITDLDVVNAYYIKDLIRQEKQDGKMIILISHDLDMVFDLADRIIVMHQGRIIETINNQKKQSIGTHLENVHHPYTLSLIQSFLKIYHRDFRTQDVNNKYILFENHLSCRYKKCELWPKHYDDCHRINPENFNQEIYCALYSKKMNSDFKKYKPEIIKTIKSSPELLTKHQQKKSKVNKKIYFEIIQQMKINNHLNDWIQFSKFNKNDHSIINDHLRERHLLLDISNLTVQYSKNAFPILRNISLEFFMFHNATSNIGIIGESGAGKTSLALTLMKAIHKKNYIADHIKIRLPAGGQSHFVELEDTRNNFHKYVQYIFQDCGQALHPNKTIRKVLNETAQISGQSEHTYERLWATLDLKSSDLNKRPGELSGGMKRRAYIVRAFTALSPDNTFPKMIITDEAVKGIDTIAQEEILTFFREEARQNNINYINISHNLSLVRALSDVIYVMLKGRIVEICNTIDFFEEQDYSPSFFHPYSRSLKYCSKEYKSEDHIIKPVPADPNKQKIFDMHDRIGCPYYAACFIKKKDNKCLKRFPPFFLIKDINKQKAARYHLVACHHVPEDCRFCDNN